MREGRATKPREMRAEPYSVLLFCTFSLAARGSAEKKATARSLRQDKPSYTILFNVTILWIPLYYHSILDRVRFEITTDETGPRSYKLPWEEADRMLLLSPSRSSNCIDGLLIEKDNIILSSCKKR